MKFGAGGRGCADDHRWRGLAASTELQSRWLEAPMPGKIDGVIRGALIGFLPLAALVGAGFLIVGPIIRDMSEAPDGQKMRAYRLTKLSDQRVIELHDQAAREFEQAKQASAEEGKKFWEERERRRHACESDPAAKLRDPNHCFEPLPIGFEEIGKPPYGWSTERFFEDSILGICEFANLRAVFVMLR
jgi:hypothetical protein